MRKFYLRVLMNLHMFELPESLPKCLIVQFIVKNIHKVKKYLIKCGQVLLDVLIFSLKPH